LEVFEFQVFLYFYGSIGGADYGSVRIGTFMGCKMIKSIASSMLSQSSPSANGANLDELEADGVELLEAEASLDYLCNLSPHRYGPLQNFPPRDILNDNFFFSNLRVKRSNKLSNSEVVV
jgi:L-arabinokinase